MSLGLQIQIQC